MNQIAVTAPRYLQKAVDTLKSLGLSVTSPNPKPIVSLISRISDGDDEKAITIARTLTQQEAFDGIVADQISQMNVGQRFTDITEGFDSIRSDAERLVSQAEKGSPDLADRLKNMFMKITRGDIADRFSRIESIYGDVVDDVQKQITREKVILEAYQDFRYALKEAEVLAHEIEEDHRQKFNANDQLLTLANQEVGAFKGKMADKARLELKRDEAMRDAQDAEERWQIAKDIAENLTVAYSVTEVTMAKLAQSHKAKDRIWKQAVVFFSTNRSVLSALKATYTGVMGLNEATKTLDAMHDGIAKSLESIATVGTETAKEALRKGYGPSIPADSVRKLVDSVVEFQIESKSIIDEMRILSTENANQIRSDVEAGKQRIAALVNNHPVVQGAA